MRSATKKMKVLTKDNRTLTVLQLGELDKSGGSPKQGSTALKCKTEGGKCIVISVQEVACFLGHYSFPPEK